MPIFSDNAPRIKVYANSHQTLSLLGSGAGNKQMQYSNVEFNNGPSAFYNWNGASGYASKPYSIKCSQNGQYRIEAAILCNRTTTAGYLHCYMYSWDSSGATVQSTLANHDSDAGPGESGWSHKHGTATLSVPANGIVGVFWYMYANTCSTYISHLGSSYCYLEVTHIS